MICFSVKNKRCIILLIYTIKILKVKLMKINKLNILKTY